MNTSYIKLNNKYFNKQLLSKLIFSIVFLIGFILRYKAVTYFRIDVGFADSLLRAIGVTELFPNNYSFASGNGWLPFFFIFFSIPLHIYYNVDSFVVFQGILSLLSLISLFFISKKYYGEKTALISLLILSFMPLHIFVTSAIFSELLFTLLLMAGCLAYEYTRKNTIYFFLASALFLSAAMTRYEGWFIFIIFACFDYYKRRNLKHTLFIFATFCGLIGLYEYAQVTVHHRQFLEGLLDNSNESIAINSRLGLNILTDRLTQTGKIFFMNTGLLFILFPTYLHRIIKSKRIKLIDSVFLIIFAMIFFSVIQSSIGIFHRYFLPLLIFLIPTTINEAILCKIKLIKWFIIPITFFTLYTYQEHYHWRRDFIGAREIIHFIENETDETKVYYDDYKERYLGHAGTLYGLFTTRRIEVYNASYNIYNDNYKGYTKKREDTFRDVIKSNKIKYLVLINGSSMYNEIFKNDKYINHNNLKVIFKSNKHELYKIIKTHGNN